MTYYTCSRDPYTDCRYCLGYLESLVNTHRHSYLLRMSCGPFRRTDSIEIGQFSELPDVYLIECVRRLLKEVIHGHFVLYQVIVVVVGNTIRCNHDKV